MKLGILLLALPVACVAARDLESLRSSALSDLFVLRDYRPGKNSFVESPARHTDAWTNTGYRYTIADLHGQGSVRHIWTTRGEGAPYFDWEFFVDGETTPSIRATDEELIEASRTVTNRVAPANFIPVDKRAFNFYLPVPFDKSLRIDVVQRQPTFWLWFCQLDYRLNDASLAGARLRLEDHSFVYRGLPAQQHTEYPRAEQDLPSIEIEPGKQTSLARLTGPAIIRELRLRWSAGVRLLVRYDGAESFAVNAPVERFFGPFKGVSFFQHSVASGTGFQPAGTASNHTSATGKMPVPLAASCYLPMPFRQNCEILIRNDGTNTATVSGNVSVESVPSFQPTWGYFHARHQRTEKTNGHRLHQVLYVRGRGHWVGMTLYRTGHDHGGGDFAVIDGEGDDPAFLHGVNGEDYFTFAWFGKGAHHPYAIAHSNDDGRYRHHLENVYPFQKSIAIEWGAFPDLSPESVAVWYQDRPDDTALADGARAESVEWDVFGPVPVTNPADPFAVLPAVADLDAGKQFECRLVKEKFTSGWMKEWSVGPMLNLTYIARHGTKIAGEIELGGMGHAFLTRRFIESDREQTLSCRFAHDDPTEVWLNGHRVYAGPSHANGFETTTIKLPLRKGRNEVVVRLTNYFNRNFNWTGFLWRVP